MMVNHRQANQVMALKQFMSRDTGDSGTLHTDSDDIPFEVVDRKVIPMPGSQTMVRLVCQNVLTGNEFNLDSVKINVFHVDWD